MRDHRKDLSTALLKHVKHTLHSQESVWVLLLADTLEKDGQVMVIIELLDLNLPVNAVLRSVLNSNGEVSSVIEAAEFGGGDVSLVESTGSGFLRCGLILGLKEADSAATETLSLLKSGYYKSIRQLCVYLLIPLAATESS